MTSTLTQTQRYASAALFGLALNQAQIHQTLLLGSAYDEVTSDRASNASSSNSSADSVADDPLLWVHDSSGLLRPVFRFLDIDSSAWSGLEETAGGSCPSQHIGAFLRLLAEDSGDVSEETSDQELALSNAVDAMVASIEITPEDYMSSKEKQRAYADELQEKLATNEAKPGPETENFKNELDKNCKNEDIKIEQGKDCKTEDIKIEHEKDGKNEDLENKQEKDCKKDDLKHEDEKDCKSSDTYEDKKECKNENLKNEHEKDSKTEDLGNKERNCKSPDTNEVPVTSNSDVEEKVNEEVKMLGYGRKVTVLYQLLSACLADIPEDNSKSKKRAKGYDARHRAALRLLSTWFDIKWIKMEAIEIIVACSAMAILKQEEAKQEEQEPKSKWTKWKRGGIIGAAAITGGTLMAITGGLAAPAIAAGFSALAPTLGTIIPVIGAGGFAAVATAAGSVAGSVAVAASFGAAGAGLTGTKMARRTGSVDEFEFKAIGENHNQGRLAVEILVSGFVFEERDFLRPWEGQTDNMERYALQWESKHLYAVSTAIQDWLSSTLAMELMRRGAMMTVLSSFLSAFAWPATLLWLTDIIDSKWTIAVNRSDKAGKLLAEVLIKGLQGNRPVTLVGFSLGARAIFKCLQHLAETGNDGLVERVVLLGAPVSIQGENWGAVRKVVSGRFINAYSTNDWMLGVAFRASLLSQGLAGIQSVNVPGIENVDVTEIIEGHSSYLWATQEILDRLELESYFPVFTKNHTKD
ncbi:transmembrane and coiled-coil domain-containing protein 4-like protein [Tanacetum coccineum]